MNMVEYDEWVNDPSPDNMAKLVDTLKPTINSEVQRYKGPRPLLRARGKGLTIKAIRSYDPSRGAQLRSWVVTNLQPLTRYGQQLRPIAERSGKTLAQLSISWVLRRPEVTAAIVGARKPEQILETAPAAGWILNDEDIEQI